MSHFRHVTNTQTTLVARLVIALHYNVFENICMKRQRDVFSQYNPLVCWRKRYDITFFKRLYRTFSRCHTGDLTNVICMKTFRNFLIYRYKFTFFKRLSETSNGRHTGDLLKSMCMKTFWSNVTMWRYLYVDMKRQTDVTQEISQVACP